MNVLSSIIGFLVGQAVPRNPAGDNARELKMW
jgi:hypothetical protein